MLGLTWEVVIIVWIILALILVLEVAVPLYQYKKTDYYKQTGASFFKVRFDPGKLGEYYIYDELKKLNGYKKWLFNCYIPKDNGETTELDVILLHESGMYVFESKNYSGWIFGTETQKYWTQTLPQGRGRSEKNHFFNPIMQNKGHLKWIKIYLGNTHIPVYSYIVFSERCTLKDVTLTSNEHFVINRDCILSSVQKTAKIAGERLSGSEIDALYEKLYPLTQLSEEQKKQHIENIQKNHLAGKPVEQKSEMSKQDTIRKEQQSEPLEQTSVLLEQSSDVATVNSGDNIDTTERTCPRCGGKLILRTSSKGTHKGNQFWGCSNFPKCRYIENVEQNSTTLGTEPGE